MGDTNKRLFGPGQITNAAVTKYTVPALTKTLVRHLHAYNQDAAQRTLTVSIGADAAGTRLFDAYPIAAKTPFDWYPFLVMDAAEIMQAYADVTLMVNLTANGTESVL